METSSTLSRTTWIYWSWWAATLAFVALLVLLGIAIMQWGQLRFAPPPVSFIQGQGTYAAEMVLVVAYGAMGWLLASRLPRNPLGWIFLSIGYGFVLQMIATFAIQAGHQAFRPLEPLVLAAGWLSSSVHLPSLILSFGLIFLLFPDGRPLSRRWAAVGWLIALGTLLVIVGVGLSPSGLIWYPSLANPLAAPQSFEPALIGVGLTGLTMVVGGVAGATGSMGLRYRRATDVQRAQLRWVAVAVVVLAACGLPFVVARYALQISYAEGELLMLVALGAGGFLPVAAAIAVLRRRLYDIDLILNRALVYIPLTGILGGLYTAGVALFQRVFVALTGDRSDGAIIITTLILASLFTPIRNHLQSFVDKRYKPSSAAPGMPDEPDEVALSVRLAEVEARLARLEAGGQR